MTQPGPGDLFVCADQLEARVCDGERIHGYDVGEDLASRFSFGEIILLALTGREPTRAEGRAFDVALSHLAAVTVAEAPAHAAVLARTCGAASAPTFGVTAIASAERAHAIVTAHRALIEWLPGCEGPPPITGAGAEGIKAAIDLDVPALAHPLSEIAAVLAVLVACGLDSAERLEAAIAIAALPVSIAEAFARAPIAFSDYPLRLPDFEYQDP